MLVDTRTDLLVAPTGPRTRPPVTPHDLVARKGVPLAASSPMDHAKDRPAPIGADLLAGGRIVIPSVHRLATLDEAISAPAPCVLLTNVHVANVGNLAKHCRESGKSVLVRPDLVEGFKPDATGMKLLRQAFHVDGVFTSSLSTARHALDAGLQVYWRVFLLDSRALATSLATVAERAWTGFEVVPGPMALLLASTVREAAGGRPLVAGGFVSDADLAASLFDAGYAAVSTSSKSLWAAPPANPAA